MIPETELELATERYRELRHQAALVRKLHASGTVVRGGPSLIARLFALMRPIPSRAADEAIGRRDIQRVLAS